MLVCVCVIQVLIYSPNYIIIHDTPMVPAASSSWKKRPAFRSYLWSYHSVEGSVVGGNCWYDSIQIDVFLSCVYEFRPHFNWQITASVRYTCLTMSSRNGNSTEASNMACRAVVSAWRPLSRPLSEANAASFDSTSQTKKNGKGKRYRETEGQRDQQKQQLSSLELFQIISCWRITQPCLVFMTARTS